MYKKEIKSDHMCVCELKFKKKYTGLLCIQSSL